MKSLLRIFTILIVASTVLSAADLLSGKWKGEIAAGPCGGFAAPGGGFPGGGGGGGFPGGGGRGGGPGFNLVAAGQRGGGGFPGGGGGGFPGGPGGGGGFPGAGRGGAAQKVTLNIKTKEDKKKSEVRLTGNITIGENTEDVRDGKVDGSKISFTTGKSPNACQYAGELDVETKELRMTRTTEGSTAPGIQFKLKR